MSTTLAKIELSERRQIQDGKVKPTLADVAEAIATPSTAIRGEIYALAKERLAHEEVRYSALSQRASLLMSATGLSLTVAFMIGGRALASSRYGWLAAIALVVGLAGLIAAGAALHALLVAPNYSAPSGRIIFNREQIVAATEVGDDEEDRLAEYQQWMTTHLWECVQRNTIANDDKASAVATAQLWFAGFLVGVAVLAALFLFASGGAQG